MFNADQKRLLALGGGGVKGVISLCILKRMEEQLRPSRAWARSSVCATSSTTSAAPPRARSSRRASPSAKSAGELIEFYRAFGAAMFQQAPLARRLWYQTFDADPLRDILRREIGEERLIDMRRSGKLKTLLLIVTRNVTTD